MLSSHPVGSSQSPTFQTHHTRYLLPHPLPESLILSLTIITQKPDLQISQYYIPRQPCAPHQNTQDRLTGICLPAHLNTKIQPLSDRNSVRKVYFESRCKIRELIGNEPRKCRLQKNVVWDFCIVFEMRRLWILQTYFNLMYCCGALARSG